MQVEELSAASALGNCGHETRHLAPLERRNLVELSDDPSDRGFESLYPSKRLLAGRHCSWSDRAGLPGVAHESLCFEHLNGICAPAGHGRRGGV